MTRARLREGALLAAIAALVCGCGFTDLHLRLSRAEADARRGPLGEIPPMSFEVPEPGDERPDRDRVGYQKDAYGVNISDLRPASPVPTLFRDAIAAELRANGHRVDPQAKLRIEAAVTLFWTETQAGSTPMTVGTAACTLSIVDRATGSAIYAGKYTGHSTHPSPLQSETVYVEALRVALGRMAWEIALDPKLVAVLRKRSG